MVGAPDKDNNVSYKNSFSNKNEGLDRNKYMQKLNTDSLLNDYVAGLFEGDGHVSIPIKGRSGTTGRPTFSITMHVDDLPFLQALAKAIGAGRIRKFKNGKAVRLDFNSLEDALAFAKLVNGKFRTPKIVKFNDALKWYNEHNNYTFPLYGINKSNILQDAWLAGFIEADGSFDIRVSQISSSAAKNRVAARFRIEQRLVDSYSNLPYESIMTKIASALNTNLNLSMHNQGIKYWSIEASSTLSRAILVNYLSTFTLFSSKYLNYCDWLTCHRLILSKGHTTQEARTMLLELKGTMNSKRLSFNWDHLSSLSGI